jgi:hypothetical protein
VIVLQRDFQDPALGFDPDRLEAYAPKGLQDSAQGFNPGNPQNERFALNGRETTDESRTSLRKKRMRD